MKLGIEKLWGWEPWQLDSLCIPEPRDALDLPRYLTAPSPKFLPLASKCVVQGVGKEGQCPILRLQLKIWSLYPPSSRSSPTALGDFPIFSILTLGQLLAAFFSFLLDSFFAAFFSSLFLLFFDGQFLCRLFFPFFSLIFWQASVVSPPFECSTNRYSFIDGPKHSPLYLVHSHLLRF